jgi:hypothetical protein
LQAPNKAPRRPKEGHRRRRRGKGRAEEVRPFKQPKKRPTYQQRKRKKKYLKRLAIDELPSYNYLKANLLKPRRKPT